MKQFKLKKVITVLILVNKKILLQLRDIDYKIAFPGTWGFISGELRTGESPLTGIKREIKEELCFGDFKNLHFSHIFINRKTENNINYIFSLKLNYIPQIKLKEGIEYSYFSKSEFLSGFKFSKKLKKNCVLAQKEIMKKKYLRILSF